MSRYERFLLVVVIILAILLLTVVVTEGQEKDDAPPQQAPQSAPAPDPQFERMSVVFVAPTAKPVPPLKKVRVQVSRVPTNPYHLRQTRSTARGLRTLRCLAKHETPGSTHPYTQKNLQGSSASGKYQFVKKTWQAWMKRAGFHGYARAMDAPPWMQEAVALFTVTHGGAQNWEGDHCG